MNQDVKDYLTLLAYFLPSISVYYTVKKYNGDQTAALLNKIEKVRESGEHWQQEVFRGLEKLRDEISKTYALDRVVQEQVHRLDDAVEELDRQFTTILGRIP